MVKVKICGITILKDALDSAEFGADAVGFNFYRKSPRCISADQAASITRELPRGIEKVGVFVNAEIDEILRTLDSAELDAAQLHGDESPSFVEDLRKRTGVKIIKAVPVGAELQTGSLTAYKCDAVLLDASVREIYGGTGETFDWELARRVSGEIPELYLAGGLTPANVAEAVTLVKPYAVDVASGVESSPGRKDPAKLEAFISNAKFA